MTKILEEKIMKSILKNFLAAFAVFAMLSNFAFAQGGAGKNGASDGEKQVTKTRVEYLPATIEKAQQALKGMGLYKGDITGKLDAGTRDAVKSFQKQEGLNPTGRLNKDTRMKLKIEKQS
jgi:peptidoglycan hydrolase-like protein with peptidoglycan-binding domain